MRPFRQLVKSGRKTSCRWAGMITGWHGRDGGGGQSFRRPRETRRGQAFAIYYKPHFFRLPAKNLLFRYYYCTFQIGEYVPRRNSSLCLLALSSKTRTGLLNALIMATTSPLLLPLIRSTAGVGRAFFHHATFVTTYVVQLRCCVEHPPKWVVQLSPSVAQ